MKSVIAILSRIPLCVLYSIADCFLYPILYYLIGYRKKMVRQNLAKAFADKTPQERHQIEKAFYKNLCTLIVEIIYGYRAPLEEMRERVQFFNHEEVNRLAKEKHGVFLMLGHMGNWEWLADYGNQVKSLDIQVNVVYRKLKSAAFDELMLLIRERRGCLPVEKKQTLRDLIKQRQAGIDTVYGMLADQKPSGNNQHYWTNFFGQYTPFLDGVEVLSKKFDYPVFYAHVSSPKRGYYRITYQLITDSPQETEQGFITEQYARKIEQNIIEHPSIWLWTHNRFKYSRPAES